MTTTDPDTLSVVGTDSNHVGRLAAQNSIALTQLTDQHSTLEQVFMGLTADAVDYDAHRLHAAAA